MKLDGRYTLAREHIGHRRGPRWVARFCDKWLGQAGSKRGARAIAAKHRRDFLQAIQNTEVSL